VKASGASRVRFIPLMLVEGVHIADDVMGDDPDSWESLIGLPAMSATGLASHPEVMEIFLENIEDLLSQF
jgi:cobalamin biosynthesis Co2+ chelatase CbiK